MRFVKIGLCTALGLMSWGPTALANDWVVMPVRAEHPPARDPTLLRLSVPLAKTIAAVVSGGVRLAKREERDDRCLDDGWRCPDEIAAMLDAKRVVSLQLNDEHTLLKVLVYAGRRGVVAQTELQIEWDNGKMSCDIEALQAFALTLAPRALDPQEVFDAFEALSDELQSCASQGPIRSGAQVNLRISATGRAHHVRIEPRKAQRTKVYRCMARVLEGLEVAPFSGPDAGPFKFTLPGRAPTESPSAK
jgi:hypothetical protein